MQTQPFRFDQRHVFVAGGTSGINLGIAQAFAQAGARVSVISRSPQKVEQAVTGLQRAGAQAYGQPADVRDPEAVTQALRAASGVAAQAGCAARAAAALAATEAASSA